MNKNFMLLIITILVLLIIYIVKIITRNNKSNNLLMKNISSSSHNNCIGSIPITRITSIIPGNIIYADEDTIIDASNTVDQDGLNTGLTYNWDLFGNDKYINKNIILIKNQNKLSIPKFYYFGNGQIRIIFTAISSKVPYLTSYSQLVLDVINNTPTLSIIPNVDTIIRNPYTDNDLIFTNLSYNGTEGNNSNLSSTWVVSNSQINNNLSMVYDTRLIHRTEENKIIFPKYSYIPLDYNAPRIILNLKVLNTKTNKFVQKDIYIQSTYSLQDIYIWSSNINYTIYKYSENSNVFRVFTNFSFKVQLPSTVYRPPIRNNYIYRAYDINNNEVNLVNPLYRTSQLGSAQLVLSKGLLEVGKRYRFEIYYSDMGSLITVAITNYVLFQD